MDHDQPSMGEATNEGATLRFATGHAGMLGRGLGRVIFMVSRLSVPLWTRRNLLEDRD